MLAIHSKLEVTIIKILKNKLPNLYDDLKKLAKIKSNERAINKFDSINLNISKTFSDKLLTIPDLTGI